MPRKTIIAGNWKMNCSREQARQLIEQIIQLQKSAQSGAELLVCVPSLHFADLSACIADSDISLGAQNAHWQASGAYTGEISASMLADYQVKYLLVGHSERREMFGDDDKKVAKKFAAALQYAITPILCIGESLQQRQQGETLKILEAQCQAVIDEVGIDGFNNACLAYEPVWAIGTGETATPQQAQQVHQHLRQFFAGYDKAIADKLPIVYGGSMKADNAESLLQQADIDGGLIGGASLNAEEFMKIYALAG